MPKEKPAIMKKLGLSGYNKPKKTPSHPTKSHVVMAKVGEKITGKLKSREGDEMKKKRTSKARSKYKERKNECRLVG